MQPRQHVAGSAGDSELTFCSGLAGFGGNYTEGAGGLVAHPLGFAFSKGAGSLPYSP